MMTDNTVVPTRVLCVEDDPDIQRIIVELLKAAGFVVTCANNGQEGVLTASSWQPDVILIDIRMPIMDGLEATRRIRSTPAIARIPVIFLSAYTDAGTRAECEAAGGNGFIAKPADITRISQIIKRVLQGVS